jgi:hypothetical protein
VLQAQVRAQSFRQAAEPLEGALALLQLGLRLLEAQQQLDGRRHLLQQGEVRVVERRGSVQQGKRTFRQARQRDGDACGDCANRLLVGLGRVAPHFAVQQGGGDERVGRSQAEAAQLVRARACHRGELHLVAAGVGQEQHRNLRGGRFEQPAQRVLNRLAWGRALLQPRQPRAPRRLTRVAQRLPASYKTSVPKNRREASRIAP